MFVPTFARKTRKKQRCCHTYSVYFNISLLATASCPRWSTMLLYQFPVSYGNYFHVKCAMKRYGIIRPHLLTTIAQMNSNNQYLRLQTMQTEQNITVLRRRCVKSCTLVFQKSNLTFYSGRPICTVVPIRFCISSSFMMKSRGVIVLPTIMHPCLHSHVQKRRCAPQ